MKRILAALFLTLSSALAVGATGQGPSEHDAVRSTATAAGKPTEARMRLAGSSNIDLRNLPGASALRRDSVKPADPEFIAV